MKSLAGVVVRPARDLAEALERFEAEQDPLIARMWALQRSFMYRDMGTVGVDVVAWRGDSPLDQVMHLVPDHRRRVSRRR